MADASAAVIPLPTAAVDVVVNPKRSGRYPKGVVSTWVVQDARRAREDAKTKAQADEPPPDLQNARALLDAACATRADLINALAFANSQIAKYRAIISKHDTGARG